MYTEIILVSFLGGFICLDRIFIQAMISRPIVVAPFIGLLLGDAYTGLITGAIIELFWLDRVPVGTYIPPNDSITAILIASAAILAGRKLGGVTTEIIAACTLIFIPFGILAKRIDIYSATANDAVSDEAMENAKAGDYRAIERKNYLGLLLYFAFVALFLLIIQLILIPLIVWLYPMMPQAVIKALTLTFYFLPLLGIAVALNTIKLRGAIPVFCVIFLIVAVIIEISHAFF